MQPWHVNVSTVSRTGRSTTERQQGHVMINRTNLVPRVLRRVARAQPRAVRAAARKCSLAVVLFVQLSAQPKADTPAAAAVATEAPAAQEAPAPPAAAAPSGAAATPPPEAPAPSAAPVVPDLT